MSSLLVYDGDCGFCTRSLGWARALGATTPAQPWQALDLPTLGLAESDVTEAAWYLDGAVRLRGHEAIAAMLRSSTHLPVRLLGRLVGSRVLRPVGLRAYAWIAAHRYQLPGGTAACRVR
jgi:predicted DCC family thiol-disulfide oxidoreductase YuxK